MSDTGQRIPGNPSRDTVALEYIKSQFFRVIHVDGAIGGPTPTGHIHLALFSERPAIPRRVVVPIANGSLGDPIPAETVVRDGMVREMDVDIMMSLSTAEQLGNLLAQIVEDIKKIVTNKTLAGE
jgi:hypothetical protein